MSPPSRGAWIEIISVSPVPVNLPSPPSRGAWIEIYLFCVLPRGELVAPLAGGVD